jgi:hypothetical protein
MAKRKSTITADELRAAMETLDSLVQRAGTLGVAPSGDEDAIGYNASDGTIVVRADTFSHILDLVDNIIHVQDVADDPPSDGSDHTWRVSASVRGSKYCGEVEAKTREEALDLAWEMDSGISLCHQCASECEDAEIDEFFVERADE